MEASVLSISNRGASTVSLCRAGSVPTTRGQAQTQAQAQAQAMTCVLRIPVLTCTYSFSRSSFWGNARSVLSSSKDGTISVLLLAFELSKELVKTTTTHNGDRRRMGGIVRSYMENKNPVFKFLNKVQGSLPIVSLVARILNPEGGVGSDRIRLEEFITRVERRSTRDAARAFYEFSERHGKVAKSQFVLIWCWAAAVGAGLLRSNDLILGASRLRVSYDLAYEVENFEAIMEEALKKRENSGSPVPDVPIELRAEKALEAILQCCTGRQVVEEEDAPLLSTILKTVFPSADVGQIDSAIQSRMLDPSDARSDSESAAVSHSSAPEESPEQVEDIGAEPLLSESA